MADAPPNEISLFIGRKGEGKTTLMKEVVVANFKGRCFPVFDSWGEWKTLRAAGRRLKVPTFTTLAEARRAVMLPRLCRFHGQIDYSKWLRWCLTQTGIVIVGDELCLLSRKGKTAIAPVLDLAGYGRHKGSEGVSLLGGYHRYAQCDPLVRDSADHLWLFPTKEPANLKWVEDVSGELAETVSTADKHQVSLFVRETGEVIANASADKRNLLLPNLSRAGGVLGMKEGPAKWFEEWRLTMKGLLG